jgi:RNA polymerase sigma factor (sigma-70 family)
MDDPTVLFQAERPRLLRIAGRLLRDPGEAEDVVQQAWLRLHGTSADVTNLPGWLTTVTTRLCLDRLRAQTPMPVAEVDISQMAPDPADEVALADTVGIALQVVLDRLTPGERVAFVLHDSFGFDFPTVAEILGVTPVAARKLASRARSKIAQPAPQEQQPDWAVVDAFMAAARGGDFSRLLELLAPDVVVSADADAVALGTPERIDGRVAVASFFNGAAQAALPIFLGDRPAAAWFHRGQAKVAFAFTILDGVVQGIRFQAAPEILGRVAAREGSDPR